VGLGGGTTPVLVGVFVEGWSVIGLVVGLVRGHDVGFAAVGPSVVGCRDVGDGDVGCWETGEFVGLRVNVGAWLVGL